MDHYFKNIFIYSNICFQEYFFFLKNPFFHIKLMYFFSFCFKSAVVGAFYISIANLWIICIISICRNLAEALPDFFQIFPKKMFVNGYVYQKSIFPVFKLLHMAGSSSFLNKEYFWLHKFCCIYVINAIVVILETQARPHYLWKSSQNFSITKAMMTLTSSVSSHHCNFENFRGWRN